MMNIEEECKQLAAMDYVVQIQCSTMSGELKFLVEAYTSPNKSGCQSRVGIACDDSLPNAMYQMIHDLNEK